MNDVPFQERIIELPSGFTLIWPFRNLAKSKGPYELVLDNNALIRSGWFSELPKPLQYKAIISPFHAFTEQWLSNSSFRDNTQERIKSMIKPFSQQGQIFEDNYEDKLTDILTKNDLESKAQWMMSYLYVVLLYRVSLSKKGDSKAKELLQSLKDIDVPRFNGCVMLCTLAGYLNENKGVKLVGDSKPAYSYISSFVDLHSKNKNESFVDENYLRNRAGDLSMWLYLPMLIQNDYQQAGEPVVVTQDKALKKLVFRCFPGVITEGRRMAFSFDENSFEPVHSQEILKRIQANITQPSPRVSKVEQLKRLERLKVHVLEGAEDILISEVESAWEDWVVPGFFGEFTL